MNHQGDGGVGDGFSHQVNALKHRIGNGGEGKEDDGRSAKHQQVPGEIPAVTEDEPQNRGSQCRHAEGTGNGDQHIELDGQPDLVHDIGAVFLGAGAHNTRDHGSSQGRSHSHRYVGKQAVLAAVDTKQGKAFFLGETFSTHQEAEHGVIHRTA